MQEQNKSSNVPTSVEISIENATLIPHTVHDFRYVSNLTEQFYDHKAVQGLINAGNPLVYEIYHHAFLTDSTDMALGMSVIYSGKVGDEYYMTKGHQHERSDQAEIYYCVEGQGLLLMDDMVDDFLAVNFSKGVAVHIPPQYAHRVVNTGTGKLIFVSTFHVAAGHKYTQVAEKGFAKIVVDEDGKPILKTNPKRAER